jgi:hypothetical protein
VAPDFVSEATGFVSAVPRAVREGRTSLLPSRTRLARYRRKYTAHGRKQLISGHVTAFHASTVDLRSLVAASIAPQEMLDLTDADEDELLVVGTGLGAGLSVDFADAELAVNTEARTATLTNPSGATEWMPARR